MLCTHISFACPSVPSISEGNEKAHGRSRKKLRARVRISFLPCQRKSSSCSGILPAYLSPLLSPPQQFQVPKENAPGEEEDEEGEEDECLFRAPETATLARPAFRRDIFSSRKHARIPRSHPPARCMCFKTMKMLTRMRRGGKEEGGSGRRR